MSPSKPHRLELGRVLAHPFWLASLALLIINDHLLKGSGLLPGWMTGKLSDVAGMFVAPALLGVLVRARTRHTLILVHVAVGTGFAAFELSSELAAAADVGYRAAGFRWQQWSDPTDLLALFLLPLSFAFTSRAARSATSLPKGFTGRLVASAGLLACVASTGDTQEVGPENSTLPPDCSEQGGSVDPNTGLDLPCEEPNSEDACDNGFDDDLDGQTDCEDSDCDAICADLEAACTALPRVEAGTTAYLSGSTLGKSSLTESDCGGADAPDTMFLVHVPTAGTLTVEVPPNHGLSVRSECSDWRSELFCIEASGPSQIPLGTEGDYVVVVEALDPLAASDFMVALEFRPVTCGDGFTDLDEDCDDGNVEDGDGCSATCVAE